MLNIMSGENIVDVIFNEIVIVENVFVGERYERNGLDVIMSIIDIDKVMERNGVIEKDDMIVRNEGIV